jgi:hypothetical protein
MWDDDSQLATHRIASELGPLPASDAKFMRRVRVHQAWYRANVLGLARFGRLAGSRRLCGSVLADKDALRNLNFLGAAALESYQARRASGWGVDPVRCTKYLTSSQTLTFNMLAEVVRHQREVARLFGGLLGLIDLAWLETADFEFSPAGTPYWLGDRTLIDLLLRFRTVDGGVQVVAVETKLADRFSTRRTAAMGGARYREVQKARSIWANLDASLAENRTRQLTRCHALAQSVQLLDSGRRDRSAVLLVLLHPEDETGIDTAELYADGLPHRMDAAFATWDAFLGAAARAGAMADDLQEGLADRYVDMTASEEAWATVRRRPTPTGDLANPSTSSPAGESLA